MGDKTNSNKTGTLKFLLIPATILSGFLAGGTIDRFVVQVPAFLHLDILNWAQYSRKADLGNGLFLYPFEAIGAFLFLMAASLAVVTNKQTLNGAAKPIYIATALSAAGLFFTIFAAPIMLNVRNIGNDPAQLQKAFGQFAFWGLFRGFAQVFAFLASIWALTKIYKTYK